MRSRETLEITSQSAMAKLPYIGIVALYFVDQRAYGGVIAKICDKGDGVENTWSSTLRGNLVLKLITYIKAE